MNQVIKEEAGALATNMFEADANHGIEICRKKTLHYLSEGVRTTITGS